ncbi:MAG TPA: cytochrome bd-I oxidase subunit CydX [Methylophilus sp.]|jgi:cytochrome bd-I ubiquinol oxidase subunit X
MWYFTWLLGVGFAVLLAILNAMWLESGGFDHCRQPEQ